MVEVITDASPWGLGGVLRVNGIILQYFASQLTADDSRILGHELGTSCGQQTWECLAVLVALRLWAAVWQESYTCLRVKSDSIAALCLTLSLKATGHGPILVARELALELGDGMFSPQVAERIPGITNLTADALSREGDPSTIETWQLPSALAAAVRVDPATRDDSWYLTRAV
jgi:hypothetical protein